MHLVRICAWHPSGEMVMDRGGFVTLDPLPPESQRTHGICRECYQKFMNEISDETSNPKQEPHHAE